MKYITLALVVSALALAGAASAQGPGSYAHRTGPYGGPLRLQAYYVASDTCQAATAARRGAPPGQAVGRDTIPVTITVGPNPKGCGNSRLVQRVMTLGGPKEVNLIRIFWVNPAGRILKIETISG